MMLRDSDIKKHIALGHIIITPTPEVIQPVSVDLHAGTTMMKPTGGYLIDPLMGLKSNDRARPINIRDGYTLPPGGFILLGTDERITLNAQVAGVVCGKSTLARFGLLVEAAGLVDPGWDGVLTLELKNLGEDIIVIRPGMKIAQIYFTDLSLPVEQTYGSPGLNSHYQGSETVQGGKAESLVSNERGFLSRYPRPEPE